MHCISQHAIGEINRLCTRMANEKYNNNHHESVASIIMLGMCVCVGAC